MNDIIYLISQNINAKKTANNNAIMNTMIAMTSFCLFCIWVSFIG